MRTPKNRIIAKIAKIGVRLEKIYARPTSLKSQTFFSTARLEDQSVTDAPPSFFHKKKSLSMSKQIPVTDLNDCLLLVTFFGFPLACCSEQDESLATVMEYQTPAGTLLKMESCVFCFDIYPHQENILPRHTTRQQLAGHNSGSVFSSRPTMFFCLYIRARHTLRARVCKRLWTHSTVNLTVPTLDADVWNHFLMPESHHE